MKMREEHRCFEEKEKSHLYKIGMFAQMNHVTIKTLRFYEEQGLLTPAFVDTENGYRYYTMDLMPAMGAEMERLGCQCALPEYCFTHYLEPGYKEEQVLVEVCEAVSEKKADAEFVKFKEFPEVQAACIYHKGSYNEFPRTYEAILKYIVESNGYEICGNIREVYIDGVWNKDSEEEWLSEIQIPVRSVEANGEC